MTVFSLYVYFRALEFTRITNPPTTSLVRASSLTKSLDLHNFSHYVQRRQTMWSVIVILLTTVTIACAETTVPGISRTISEGVSSMGYKIIYGDEDLTELNEVVNDAEKNVLKPRHKTLNGIEPLKAQDVKCLMSVDRYCSPEMGEVKSE